MNLHQVISVLLIPTLYVLFLWLEEALAQNPDPLFELPVQLVGFPVIVLSVRLSQFAKKLAYSLSPSTYRGRSKRDAARLVHDADIAHKTILSEFGAMACILEEPCRVHATRPRRHAAGATPHAAWTDILSNYKVQSTGNKQWYLLSVFIGDAVRDVQLCRHLAKRLPCPGVGRLPAPLPR